MQRVTAAAATAQEEIEKVLQQKCSGTGAGGDREDGEGIQEGSVCLSF